MVDFTVNKLLTPWTLEKNWTCTAVRQSFYNLWNDLKPTGLNPDLIKLFGLNPIHLMN